MEKKKIIYLLGEVYGALCEILIDDVTKQPHPDSFQRASMRPMREITVMYGRNRSNLTFRKKFKKLDEYIGLRLNEVDTSDDSLFDGSVLPMELQGTFYLGYENFRNSYKYGTVKDLVAKTGLTQAELAEKLGVAGNTVSRWCTGTSNISEEMRLEIEKIIMDNWK